jgi:hypothetical protein
MGRWKLGKLVLVACLGLGATAHEAAADYGKVAPIRPLTMSDPAGLSVVGLEFQYTSWTVPAPPVKTDVTALTFDAFFDYRLAPHWVVFAKVPFDKASVDDGVATTDCCDLALGNITLGGQGLWSTKYESDLRGVVGGELSLSLPTASDSGNGGASSGAAALAHLPHDPGLYAPNVTTVRLGVLSQLYSRRFLAHATAGLNLHFFDGDVPGDDHFDLSVHLGLALGVRITYEFSFLAELNSNLFSGDNFGGNDVVSSLDAGLRYGSGRAIFGGRFYFPIDSELRDLGMIGFGLDGGYRF